MKNHLELGNWNALCDSCGRKFKASDLQRRWDGLIVCSEDYETRHPSDFLRVREERITVAFSNPEPSIDIFIGGSCSIVDMSGRAGVGTADCARVEYTPTFSIDDVGLNWLYKDLYPALAGLAQAGESTSGIIHSLQPGV